MFVFYDPGTLKALFTAWGNKKMLTEGRTDWIEAPDQELLSLEGVTVQNGQMVIDPQHPGQRLALSALIDQERDRRMKMGLTYLDVIYDFDDISKSRITGMATLAGFALGQGAQPGDYLWHGGQYPFVWVAQDNSFVPMDAPTCFGLGQVAATHEMTYIFAARALKDSAVIPTDFTEDVYWP